MLARGPLKPALLASTALPGVFPIVHHDGRRLVDGGVVDNVPLSHALAGPVDRVFVLNVSSGPSDRVERSPLDVVMTSFGHARSQRFELELRFVPPEIEVIVLPRPPDPRDLFDFSGSRELIDAAYELANEALDQAAVPPATAEQRRRFRLPPWSRSRATCGSNAGTCSARDSKLGGVLREVEHAAGHDAEEQHRRRRDRERDARAEVDAGPRGGRRLLFVFGRRVHREDDPQVDERRDRGREHADQREHVLALRDRGAEHRELRHEAAR